MGPGGGGGFGGGGRGGFGGGGMGGGPGFGRGGFGGQRPGGPQGQRRPGGPGREGVIFGDRANRGNRAFAAWSRSPSATLPSMPRPTR